MKFFDLVIFDFDGTLANSAPWFKGIVDSLADRFSFRKVDDDEYERLRGEDSVVVLATLGVPKWKIPMIARHLHRLVAEDWEKITLFDGVGDMLRRLDEAGVTLAMVSSNSEDNVRRILGPDISARFDHFACGANAFGKAKKFRAVLRALKADRTRTLAVGDEERDIKAAHDAKIMSGSVAWGYATPDILKAGGPDHFFETMDDIVAAVLPADQKVVRGKQQANKPTIAQFIVNYLDQRNGPATNGEILLAFETDGWTVIPKTVRGELSRLASSGQIRRVQTGLYEAVGDRKKISDLNSLPDVESQTAGALRFSTEGQGPVDVDLRAGASELLNDPDAIDRHSETTRLAKRLIDSYDHSERGANAARETVEDTRLLVEALGKEPNEARPGLVIPRGEALRQMLAAQENLDEFSDIAPLSDRFKAVLKNLVGAYNVYVGLDPELARRDEAQLGPDSERDMVSPESGMQAARSAAELGAATERAANALAEEAKVAPSEADATNRLSRRFSEGSKNLARALLPRAVSGVKWIAAHPFASSSAVVGAGVWPANGC